MAPNYGSLDSYWRLDEYHTTRSRDLHKRLKDAGYGVASSTSRPWLVALAQRIDCALLCYEKCSVKELENIAYSRGIAVLDKDTPIDIWHRLMSADTRPVFHRFLQLPPELRNRIYSFHVASFPNKLMTPSQPPLARTNRLIRNEFLPVFYGEISIRLEFFRIGWHPVTIRPSPDTTVFLETLSKQSAAELRLIDIRLRAKPHANGKIDNSAAYCSITIDLGVDIDKMIRVKIPDTFFRQQGLPPQAAELYMVNCKEVEKDLRRTLKSVTVVEGKRRLKVEDIYAVRRVLLAAFP